MMKFNGPFPKCYLEEQILLQSLGNMIHLLDPLEERTATISLVAIADVILINVLSISVPFSQYLRLASL